MIETNRKIKRVGAAKGALIVVAMRWIDRLIGVISTLILARLLVPDDFGIVAMGSIVVGLIDTLLDLGVGSALIQNKDADRDDFDTAWTLRLAQAVLAALLLWASAPLAADYFRDPRVIDVIRVLALAILVGGFENIGIVAFQKNMEFGRDFQFFFFRRLAGFVVTIALAFWWHSYWAMVVGAVATRSFGTVFSYVIHDYRPRFSITRVAKIWSFSQWILVRNLGIFGLLQIDKFLVGGRTNASTLGAYTLANEIAVIPTTELLAPISRVLFPVFVDAAKDPVRLRAVFCKAIGVQSLVALPAGVGLSMVASDAVLLLLGEQWQQVVPLLQMLALISMFSALTYSSGYMLMALGKVFLQAISAWLQLGLLAFLAIIVFPEIGAYGIATIRLATTALGLVVFVIIVLHYVKVLKLRDFVDNTWRPICATGIMALVLSIVPPWDGFALFVRLIFSIGTGMAVYALSILLLWRISNCREGAETYLLEQLRLKDRLPGWMLPKR